MKRILLLASSAISLLSASIALNIAFQPSPSAKADGGSTYSTILVKEKSYYEVSSDGSPFYLTFGAPSGVTSLEMCRFTYMMKSVEYSKVGETSCGSFISDTTNISSLDSITSRSPWSDDAINYLATPNTAVSLLAFRASETADTTSYIIRRGIDSYTQTPGGDFKNAINSDSQYGLYFSGLKVSFSFISLYEYGSNFTIHYTSGVSVKETSSQIAPTINVDSNIALYSKDGHEAINGSLFFDGYSLVAFKMKESTPENIITFDGVKVNGTANNDIKINQDGDIYYFGLELKNDDVVKLSTVTKTIRIDKDVKIYDLADIAQEKKVEFTELQQSGKALGNIPNKPNTAFRFLFHTPASGWTGEAQTKFGIYSNNSSLWSNFGYIVRIREGNVALLTGEEVLLSSLDDTGIASSSTLKVEVGLKKIYDTSDHYFANYLYLNINDVLKVSYSDSNLSALGSLITKPYIGDKNGLCSFEDVRKDTLGEIKDVSKLTGVSLSYPRYFEKGQDVKVTLVPEKGYKILSFKANGTDVALTRSGNSFTATLLAPSSDVAISYSLLPNATSSLKVDISDDYSASYSSSIAYGDTATILFTPKRGKAFTSVLVTEEGSPAKDLLTSLVRDGAQFSLRLEPMFGNINVKATLKDASYKISEDSANAHAKTTFSETEAKAGDSLSFFVTAEEGYKVQAVYVNGVLASESNGAYGVDYVYEDIVIKVDAIKDNAYVASPSKENNVLGIVLMSVGGSLLAIVVAFGAFLFIKNKKKNKSC